MGILKTEINKLIQNDQIKCWFSGEGKTGAPGEKPLSLLFFILLFLFLTIACHYSYVVNTIVFFCLFVCLFFFCFFFCFVLFLFLPWCNVSL